MMPGRARDPRGHHAAERGLNAFRADIAMRSLLVADASRDRTDGGHARSD